MSRTPNIGTMELLAISDPAVFRNLAESVGLRVLGTQSNDPLDLSARAIDVEAIASELTESTDDHLDIPPYLRQLKELAEALGYVVAIS